MAQVYPTDGRADGGLLDGVLGGRSLHPGADDVAVPRPDDGTADDAPGDDALGDDGTAAGYPGPDEPVDESEPIDVPEPPQTGDTTVDEAVRLVAKAVRYPLEDQVPVYDAVHRGLQDRLADVED